MLRLVVISVAFLTAAAATEARSDDVIYSTARAGEELIKIDPHTGKMEVVGSLGVPGSAPLAGAPDGTLYTVTDSLSVSGTRSQFAKVDQKTGKATPIGEPWGKPIGILGLDVAPDGTIYAAGVMENKLYRIDPATGSLTEIGQFEGGKNIVDFAFHPQTGEMYAVGYAILYKLDPKTAQLTEVAPITNAHPDITGIAFASDSTLYATNGGRKSWLYKLDPSTAVGEKIADLPSRDNYAAVIQAEQQ